ncbi:hypothetical protein MRX96_059858 [Rhipicephalus microplus]
MALGILGCVVVILTLVNIDESIDEDEPPAKASKGWLFADALSGSLKTAVDRLRRLRVSHFSTLSLYGKYATPPKLRQCIKILRVRSVGDFSREAEENYGDLCCCSDFLWLSYFVALTHLPFADRKRIDCRILPMTVLDFPAVPPRREIKYAVSILLNSLFKMRPM